MYPGTTQFNKFLYKLSSKMTVEYHNYFSYTLNLSISIIRILQRTFLYLVVELEIETSIWNYIKNNDNKLIVNIYQSNQSLGYGMCNIILM